MLKSVGNVYGKDKDAEQPVIYSQEDFYQY